MDNISHLLEVIQTLSSQLFVFRTNIEPLTLLKDLPEDLSSLINDPHLSELVDSACLAAKDLNDFLQPFLKQIFSYTHKKKSDKDHMVPYADFTVDSAPLLKAPDHVQIRFEDIPKSDLIRPVRHRANFNYEGSCPHCGAPNQYLYLNNGRNQYACKVCHKTFTDKVIPRGTSGFYCPHCGTKLSAHHDRKGYIVYVCQSRRCSYYKDRKARHDAGEALDLLTSSKQFRYHYHYRQFKFNLDEIRHYSDQLNSPVNLAKIHHDQYTLGLILTYHINYGLSSRKTVNIMRDIHGIRVSHQTVHNYAQAVASLIKDMVDFYPYDLSSVQAGDETYVHINGKNNYVFFFSDPFKKIITSYNIFPTRNTKDAVLSMYNVIRKFSSLPDDLTFITDGNPIYNAAQLFFEMYGIPFDLHQVIGVKNNDETSKTYRPFKQMEERLNRTFKENYYPKNGFGSLEQANSYMVLYSAFFNFLRRHSALDYKPPVKLEIFDDDDLMPDKWLRLIEASSDYHPTSNTLN